MKQIVQLAVLAAAFVTASNFGTHADAQGYVSVWYGPVRHYGYVYYPPRAWAVPPPPPVYYANPWYGGYYGRVLPPYGFGSPYYNGYNDPYFYSYGPGMRQFLQFGGADFYGW